MGEPADGPSDREDRAPMGLRGLLSRRVFLRHGGGLAGMALLLSACSAPAPSQPPVATSPVSPTSPPKPVATTPPAPTAAAGTRFGGVLLPTYVPSTLGTRADLPSSGPNVSDGFLSYPQAPPRATAETPGRG